MAVSIRLYGSETWALSTEDQVRSGETKFLRAVKGCSVLDKIKKYKDIRHDLIIREYSLTDKVKYYKIV